MIKELSPLTKNKLEILKFIYEKHETHLLDIAKHLEIHPFSLQKTLKSLKSVLEEKKTGRTIVLKIDKNIKDYFELIYVIEDYKLKNGGRILKLLVKSLKEFFSKDRNVLTCVLFGSFARGAFDEKSDIDLLFVVKSKVKQIEEKCSQLSTLLGREINPIVMNEREFGIALQAKEPAIASLLEPSQRLLIIGKEYFLRNTYGT